MKAEIQSNSVKSTMPTKNSQPSVREVKPAEASQYEGNLYRLGFNNWYGEQNCFLNVCMQALLSLECVRNQVSYLSQHALADVKDPLAQEFMVIISL